MDSKVSDYAPTGLCPWGFVDFTRRVAPGVWYVSTRRHGGFYLSPNRVAEIPPVILYGHDCEEVFSDLDMANGWFERDVTASRAVVGLPSMFPPKQVTEARRVFWQTFPRTAAAAGVPRC